MAATESAKMQKKSLNSSPDQTRTFEKEKIELANLVVMLLVNNKEHDLVFKAAGISRELVWIQHLPQGDFAIACYETDDPEQSLNVLATSSEPWAAKLREHLNKAHALDITHSSMKLNELVVNWKG